MEFHLDLQPQSERTQRSFLYFYPNHIYKADRGPKIGGGDACLVSVTAASLSVNGSLTLGRAACRALIYFQLEEGDVLFISGALLGE